jgi:AraC-like DNA-binding protein
VEFARRCSETLAVDLARRWTVGDLAHGFGLTPRTLQRRLQPEGGFGRLLNRARAEQAARMLVKREHELGIIGFACGYSDQPHFTREFKRRTAMTPAQYRQAFAHPASEAGRP